MANLLDVRTVRLGPLGFLGFGKKLDVHRGVNFVDRSRVLGNGEFGKKTGAVLTDPNMDQFIGRPAITRHFAAQDPIAPENLSASYCQIKGLEKRMRDVRAVAVSQDFAKGGSIQGVQEFGRAVAFNAGEVEGAIVLDSSRRLLALADAGASSGLAYEAYSADGKVFTKTEEHKATQFVADYTPGLGGELFACALKELFPFDVNTVIWGNGIIPKAEIETILAKLPKGLVEKFFEGEGKEFYSLRLSVKEASEQIEKTSLDIGDKVKLQGILRRIAKFNSEINNSIARELFKPREAELALAGLKYFLGEVSEEGEGERVFFKGIKVAFVGDRANIVKDLELVLNPLASNYIKNKFISDLDKKVRAKCESTYLALLGRSAKRKRTLPKIYNDDLAVLTLLTVAGKLPGPVVLDFAQGVPNKLTGVIKKCLEDVNGYLTTEDEVIFSLRLIKRLLVKISAKK